MRDLWEASSEPLKHVEERTGQIVHPDPAGAARSSVLCLWMRSILVLLHVKSIVPSLRTL